MVLLAKGKAGGAPRAEAGLGDDVGVAPQAKAVREMKLEWLVSAKAEGVDGRYINCLQIYLEVLDYPTLAQGFSPMCSFARQSSFRQVKAVLLHQLCIFILR